MAKIQKELQQQNLHKVPVYITDTDPTSRYFQIRELPDVFHAGKNGFLLIGSKELLNTTSVLVEILDANGNPIFQQPIARYAEGQARVISIEIYEDTPPGPAQITILGVLARADDNNPIPPEWQNRYNVKWQKTVPVDSLRPNTSKIRTYKRPTLNVTELLSPFRKAETGSIVTRLGGGSAAGESSIRSTGDARVPVYKIRVAAAGISQSMLGGAFTASWGGASLPGSSSYDGEATFTGSYSASIVEIYDDTTFLVSPPLQNVAKTNYQNFITSNYTISYQDRPVFTNTALTRSFAEVFLSELRTFTGDIQRSKIFVKSLDSEGAYEQIYDAQIEGSNLTQTSSVTLGVAAKMGQFYSQSVINEFWVAGYVTGATLLDQKTNKLIKYPAITPYSSSTNFAPTRNTAKLIDSLWVPAFEIAGPASPIGFGQLTSSAPTYFIAPNQTFKFNDELEYTLTGDVLCEVSGSPAGGPAKGRLDVYLSGSAFPNVTSSLGKLIAWFDFDADLPSWSGAPSQTTTRPFRNFAINFVPPRDGTAQLFFALSGGTWFLSDINLVSSIERGFNPDEAKFLVPIFGKRFETLQFKAQLFDPSNNVFPYEVISPEVWFDGGNVFLRGGDNRIEGSLTVSPSGSGVTMTSRGWYSASVFQIGESAMYLGDGEFASSSTPFLVGQSGSNNDPFFSISDKLIGYNDPDTGEFQLVLSGSLTVISGTLQVDRLSDITGNLGVVIAGRVQNKFLGSTAGIQLGGLEYTSSTVPTSWNAYLNLAATSSQPVLFVRPESGSDPLVTITAEGGTFFGASQGDAVVFGQQGKFTTLFSPSLVVQPITSSAPSPWTGSRIEASIGDLSDPGQDLFYIYNNRGENDPSGNEGVIFSVDRYTVLTSEGDTGSANLTATSSTNWQATASVIHQGTTATGSENTTIALSGAGVDAYDDYHVVRWGMTLDNSSVSVEPGGSSTIEMIARLQWRKDGSPTWTTVTTKFLSENIDSGVGTSQSSLFSTTAQVTGVPTTVDFRVLVSQTRVDSGIVSGPSKAHGYGETATGVTWIYDAGGGGGGGFVTKERFNPRFYGGVSASTAVPHYQMVPTTNSVSLPPNASGSEGEFIYISGSGPFYHDGAQWNAYGSGSAGTVLGSGTADKIAKWSAASTLANSNIDDDGTEITLGTKATASAGIQVLGQTSVITASFTTSLGGYSSASWAESALSASYAKSASAANNLWVGNQLDAHHGYLFEGNPTLIAAVSFSDTVPGGAVAPTGTIWFNTGSGILSASYALSASHAENADSSLLAVSAVTATTASYALAVAPEAFNDPRQVVTSTDAFYVVNEDTDFTIFIDTTSADGNVKLPNITGGTNGRLYNIIKVVAANIAHVIAFDSNDDIIGSATKSLTDQYQSLTVQASGSTWWII